MVTLCYDQGKNCSGHNSEEKYHNISNPTVQQQITHGNSYHGFTSETDTDSISSCEFAIHSPATSDTYCSTELLTILIHIEIKLSVKQIELRLLTVHTVVEFLTVYTKVKFPIKQILLKIVTVHIVSEFSRT